MARCVAPAALGLALFTASAVAQEASATPKSALREFMRDAVKARIPAEKPPESPPAPTSVTAAPPVKMEPFVVREKRAPRITGLDEEMQKQVALKSHALYHTELTGKVRLEIGLPPEAGGIGGGFTLPLLRLSW